ncbi:short-chain dehydrogenase, putative [Talaromyces stipitatus ATCC 10500]|uniref:Short-chain dehydrogenase, putative n=1 Tax=Talaromyces stipitatus (strain ATCC 10500 / CBS 375.48 / QM 6759 / NRRL 1006) TaxID=441959 RepID=B8MMQ3_TALSN|nr:short-chain dehydrogenase, putative [Talaromyces stipitatus ATCC 10500]EED13620.1 short-chain dehydrogenase, putative [Talaromyces stipitatus ATCC 10500]
MSTITRIRPQSLVNNALKQTKPTLDAHRYQGGNFHAYMTSKLSTYDTERSYSLFQKTLQDPLRTSPSSLAGKSILVTGSNTGLGFEAALKSVDLGAKHVILGVRNVEKGEHAKQRILQRATSMKAQPSDTTKDGNPDDQTISVRKLDMSDYNSIHSFVKEVGKKDGRLDVAILNAGVFGVKYETAGNYGWENDLQVNVLSTALLSLLLLQAKIIKPEVGVLEFVASRRMQAVQLTEEEKKSHNLLETFNRKQNFNASRQYQVSKLLLMAFYQSLASRSAKLTEGSPIITAVCPGFCQSDLSRGHQGFAADVLRAVLNTFVLRRAEEGARTLVSGALGTKERHGKFWFDDGLHDIALPDSVGDAQGFADRIWEEVVHALQRDTNAPLV